MDEFAFSKIECLTAQKLFASLVDGYLATCQYPGDPSLLSRIVAVAWRAST